VYRAINNVQPQTVTARRTFVINQSNMFGTPGVNTIYRQLASAIRRISPTAPIMQLLQQLELDPSQSGDLISELQAVDSVTFQTILNTVGTRTGNEARLAILSWTNPAQPIYNIMRITILKQYHYTYIDGILVLLGLSTNAMTDVDKAVMYNLDRDNSYLEMIYRALLPIPTVNQRIAWLQTANGSSDMRQIAQIFLNLVNSPPSNNVLIVQNMLNLLSMTTNQVTPAHYNELVSSSSFALQSVSQGLSSRTTIGQRIIYLIDVASNNGTTGRIAAILLYSFFSVPSATTSIMLTMQQQQSLQAILQSF
jgi:hypothetical protein